MRLAVLVSCLLAASVTLAPKPAAAIKEVSYPEVKVEVPPPFAGDPALDAMRRKLSEAAANEDLAALTTLVAPDFAWVANGDPVDEFDPKRDAVHNFKVAFGFRPHGKDADGPTEIGPQWDLLEFFATESGLSQAPGSPHVCAPVVAQVIDHDALERALERVEENDEVSEWVYPVDEIALTAAPTGGETVAKLANAALPIIRIHPTSPATDRDPMEEPTHVELLLPSGKSAWASLRDVQPLFVDRLCYAKVGDAWRISVYDQAE